MNPYMIGKVEGRDGLFDQRTIFEITAAFTFMRLDAGLKSVPLVFTVYGPDGSVVHKIELETRLKPEDVPTGTAMAMEDFLQEGEEAVCKALNVAISEAGELEIISRGTKIFFRLKIEQTLLKFNALHSDLADVLV